MQDIQIFPKQATDNKTIIEIMKFLSNYFSPETIEFAEEKIPSLAWFIARKEKIILWFIAFDVLEESRTKIYWMGVLPTYQRQLIWRILLKHTENLLQNQWIKEIELLTLDEHPDYPGYLFTREFYKKHWFEITDFEIQDDIKILTMTKAIS